MKAGKRILALALLVLIVAGLLPMKAAAIDHIDLTKTVSLDVLCKYEKTPLVNAQFKVYRVADPDVQCNLFATAAFSDFLGKNGWLQKGTSELIPLENAETGAKTWQTLNDALMLEVQGNHAKYDKDAYTFKTDESGMLHIKDIPVGLYLIWAEPHEQGKVTYEQKPILVMMPERFGGEEWVYNRPYNPDPDKDLSIHNKPGIARNALMVEKIWEDGPNGALIRPKHLIIELYCDGKLYDTVTLPIIDKETGENIWKYTWDKLEYGHTWTVKEKKDSYLKDHYDCGDPEMTLAEDGETPLIVWTIVNTYRPPILPQTGQLWWPVPVLLIVGMLFVLAGLIRRRGDNCEA